MKSIRLALTAAKAQPGTSTSVVKGITLGDLLKGYYAINVHKSASDLGACVSCGDIKA